MWLVHAYWRLCGVFAVDLSYNEFQHVYSVLLLLTSVYNFISASSILCKQDQWCVIFSPNLIEMYDRMIAFTAFMSRIAIVYKCKQKIAKYQQTVGASEVYSPTTAEELKTREAFTSAVVTLCLIVILPINISRLYYLYYYESDYDVSLLVYYTFLYVQNLSMCCVETQFVTQCFVIYTKFRRINGDLRKLKDENVDLTKYPFVIAPPPDDAADDGQRRRRSQRFWHRRVFYGRTGIDDLATANAIEVLRIRHWLIRQSVDILNDMFGIHMGLSVFYVWMVALFDIYYEIFHESPSKILVYAWMLQYSLRLFMIVLAAHYTTKEALETKSLITHTNNGILDNSTKEELQLFINQIHSSPIEFTAYDFFTLNKQLIKSVIAAGATYLVILVQLHSGKH